MIKEIKVVLDEIFLFDILFHGGFLHMDFLGCYWSVQDGGATSG